MQCIYIRVDGELLAGLAGEPTQRAIPAFGRACEVPLHLLVHIHICMYIYTPYIHTDKYIYIHTYTYAHSYIGGGARRPGPHMRACMHTHVDIAYMTRSRSDTHAYRFR